MDLSQVSEKVTDSQILRGSDILPLDATGSGVLPTVKDPEKFPGQLGRTERKPFRGSKLGDSSTTKQGDTGAGFSMSDIQVVAPTDSMIIGDDYVLPTDTDSQELKDSSTTKQDDTGTSADFSMSGDRKSVV